MSFNILSFASLPRDMRSYYVRLFWIGILLFFIFIGVIIAFGNYYFQIRNIEVLQTTDDNLRYDDLRKMLEYTKNHNTLILSTDYLEKSLLIRFPELQDISITKSLPDTLIIEPVVDPVVIKWVYKKPGDDVEYFGYVTNRGMFLKNGPTDILTVYDVQSPVSVPKFYTTLIPEKDIQIFLEGKRQVEAVILRPIVSMKYLRNAQEIHFIDEKGVAFWFYLEESMENQVDKLSSLVQTHNVLGGDLEYVDLRISKKVIYK